MDGAADLVVSGVTYRRNLFGEWCEVSAESGELHIAYQESDCLDEIEALRSLGDELARRVAQPCRCVEAHDGAINETCAVCAAYFDWQEHRRGVAA